MIVVIQDVELSDPLTLRHFVVSLISYSDVVPTHLVLQLRSFADPLQDLLLSEVTTQMRFQRFHYYNSAESLLNDVLNSLIDYSCQNQSLLSPFFGGNAIEFISDHFLQYTHSISKLRHCLKLLVTRYHVPNANLCHV